MSAANCKIPPTTVALQIGSKFIAVDWRVSRIDPDNSSVVPVVKDGTAYVPAKAVAEAFGGSVTGNTVTLGGQTLSLLQDAPEENGAVLVPASAFADAFGFFAKYYPDAPYAEGVVVISSEHFYTDDAEAADAINPVTIHAVALLLARVRETRAYISVELPKAFYDLADPGPDKGKTEGFIREMAGVKVNLDLYPIPPEAEKKEGVPAGTVTKMTLADCKIYPGVPHDLWTYVPAQYDGRTPLNLIIFTDGHAFFEGAWKLQFDMPTVLDNMIHEGQIPPTAALFIAPGTVGDGYPVWGRLAALDNRSTELDAADERYANFLCDEVIPFALKDIVLADDPRKRAIWGVSSGGAASLTACWHRSDQIGTALMACSSVAIMRMAGLLQFALRNQLRKDIQVVLMAGEHDHTQTTWGNWPTVSQMVGESLAFNHYQHLYLVSKGGHSYEWPARITPQILRTVWMGQEFRCPNVEVRSRNGL